MKEKTTAGETAIQVFNSERFGRVRTAGTPEEPLFCLADLCKALGLSASHVKPRLSDGVVSTDTVLDSKGRRNKLNFVNEDGLYDVILDSRKPEARAFRKWITSEVLPSIRKTGGYMAATPDETPEQVMARALKIADETIRRQQEVISGNRSAIAEKNGHIRRLLPLACYAREVAETGATYTMTETASFLGFRAVSDFMDWCVNEGVLCRKNGQWTPTALFKNEGYFTKRIYRRVVNEYIEEKPYTVVTERGRMMLFNKMYAMTEEGGER